MRATTLINLLWLSRPLAFGWLTSLLHMTRRLAYLFFLLHTSETVVADREDLCLKHIVLHAALWSLRLRASVGSLPYSKSL